MSERYCIKESFDWLPHPFEPGGWNIWVLLYNDGTVEVVTRRVRK